MQVEAGFCHRMIPLQFVAAPFRPGRSIKLKVKAALKLGLSIDGVTPNYPQMVILMGKPTNYGGLMDKPVWG